MQFFYFVLIYLMRTNFIFVGTENRLFCGTNGCHKKTRKTVKFPNNLTDLHYDFVENIHDSLTIIFNFFFFHGNTSFFTFDPVQSILIFFLLFIQNIQKRTSWKTGRNTSERRSYKQLASSQEEPQITLDSKSRFVYSQMLIMSIQQNIK